MTASIKYPTSSIQHRASSIEHPASSIQYRASSIEYPRLIIPCSICDFCAFSWLFLIFSLCPLCPLWPLWLYFSVLISVNQRNQRLIFNQICMYLEPKIPNSKKIFYSFEHKDLERPFGCTQGKFSAQTRKFSQLWRGIPADGPAGKLEIRISKC